MANPEHLAILKQGVEAWNEWREDNPGELSDIDLGDADLTWADLPRAVLTSANLENADLRRANLREANLSRANLGRTNLGRVDLSDADLGDADLCGALLTNTNLSNAVITGAKLYGTARDDWKIDGIKCDYIYFDYAGKKRIPKDRNFRPSEFEELYKQLPTFEYHFEHGFTPLDPLIMDQVVAAINEKCPEFELKLDSFHSRGRPHAKFTVLHKESVEEVRKQVAREYEGKLKYIEGRRDQLMELISTAIKRPQNITYNQDTINIQRVEGSSVNVKSDITQKNG